MYFKLLYVFLLLWTLCQGATAPESECFNPTLKSYASVDEFVKEVTAALRRKKSSTKNIAADAAQSLVCASALFKWMRTFGTKSYTVDAYNWTPETIRIFGQDVTPNNKATGQVYNDKGYFFWREAGVCYMTRFGNNSSVTFNENIQIKPGQQIWGGTRRRPFQLRTCKVVTVDDSLCNNATITYEMEAYVMGKWLSKMKSCKTNYS